MLSTSTPLVGFTANRLIRANAAGTALVDSLLSDDGTNTTQVSGTFGTSATRIPGIFAGTTGIDSTGAITVADDVVISSATNAFRWTGASRIVNISDGIIRLSNNLATDLSRLIFGPDSTGGVSLVKTGTAFQVALGDGTLGGSIMGIPVAVQTIAAGGTIAANACGTIKRISSAGVVTTDTVNTFTAPAAANAGCTMYVINVGANNITLDANANFVSPGGADVVMTPNDAILVGSTGAGGAWYALSALVAN